jgi:hypothetical protein
LKSVKLQTLDILVSFNFVSLFTNLPVDEALKVISNKLHNDFNLVERSTLHPEAIMAMLKVCLRTTYFRMGDTFFQQKDGMTMGSSLSRIVSGLYLVHLDNMTPAAALHKPPLCPRYLDDTFVVWPHGPEQLQNLFGHLNSLRQTVDFLLACSGHQEGDDTDHQSLQKAHPHWPISHFQL